MMLQESLNSAAEAWPHHGCHDSVIIRKRSQVTSSIRGKEMLSGWHCAYASDSEDELVVNGGKL